MDKALKLLLLATVASGVCAGCNSDDSMSGTVKPNPTMANRYKQSGSNPTAPKSGATTATAPSTTGQ